MKETELFEPVKLWLESQGYVVYSEISLWGVIDVVGLRGSEVVAVELKTCCSEKLFRQTYLNQMFFHRTYGCCASRPKDATLEKWANRGMGLLRAVDGIISIILESKDNDMVAKSSIMDRLSHATPGGVGGRAVEKGCGPAICVYELVKEYRLLNPGATWKQIYENVPNHYCSATSMSCSMLKKRNEGR